MKKVSAGILLYRFVDDDLEVFLGHPGGPYFTHKEDGVWCIPKGEVNDGEDIEAAARREFLEETGKFLGAVKCSYLGLFSQSRAKNIHVFVAEMDTDIDVESNMFEMEYPKGSGIVQMYPELDKADWFKVNEAKKKILKGQGQVIDKLIEVNGNGI